jgi:hypothetical protein
VADDGLIGVLTLIDLVNQYRERGRPLAESVTEGARKRLRPIVMTAAATVLALTPMAFGVTGGGVFISQPLALVVIGGLISSTVLTLLLVPVLYTALERAGSAVATAGRPPRSRPPPPSGSRFPPDPRPGARRAVDRAPGRRRSCPCPDQCRWARQSAGTRPRGPGAGWSTGWCSGGASSGPSTGVSVAKFQNHVSPGSKLRMIG